MGRASTVYRALDTTLNRTVALKILRSEQTLLGHAKADVHSIKDMKWKTISSPEKADYSAPDGSEIRLLPNMKGGGLCHCTLPPNAMSSAIAHKTVEEIWYVFQGQGQVWRKSQEHEEVVDVCPGVCLTIPPHTQFQFRNMGSEPLIFIIATMPPWPGPQEAMKVTDHWSSASTAKTDAMEK